MGGEADQVAPGPSFYHSSVNPVCRLHQLLQWQCTRSGLRASQRCAGKGQSCSTEQHTPACLTRPRRTACWWSADTLGVRMTTLATSSYLTRNGSPSAQCKSALPFWAHLNEADQLARTNCTGQLGLLRQEILVCPFDDGRFALYTCFEYARWDRKLSRVLLVQVRSQENRG